MGEVLRDARWRGRASWQRLVGATLAEATALVGIDHDGTVRVMARNETAQRELLAREEHLLASWNASNRGRAHRQARKLVCWLRPDLVTRPAPEGLRPRRAVEPTDEHRSVAAAAGAGVRDARVREVLIEARARSLARAQRDAAATTAGEHGSER